jgi:tartrate dehydrogenase/decarboxylase/D-malate dehydrogenase
MLMMLDFFGEAAAGAAIVRAIESALEPGSDAPRTPDIGGKARTSDLGKAIAEAV